MTSSSPDIPVSDGEADDIDRAPKTTYRSALSWSLVGGVLASGVVFLQTIFAGRLLGPSEYGAFAFAQALLMVLLLPFLASFDMSTSRALARARDAKEHEQISSTSFVAVLVCSTVFSIPILLLRDPIGRLLHADLAVITAATIMAILFAQRWLIERQLGGLLSFRRQAIARALEAATNISVFMTLVFGFDQRTYLALVFGYCAGALVFFGFGASDRAIRLRFSSANTDTLRRLLPYVGLMSMQYVFFTLLAQLDKFVINTQLGAAQLGIYTAYYAGTIFLVQQLVMLTTNVLYPMLSRQDDLRSFIRRVDRLAPLLVVGGAGVLLMSSLTVLTLFGVEYPFSWQLAGCFAAWGAIQGTNGVYVAIAYAHSGRTAARQILFQPVRLALLIAWFVVMTLTDRLTLQTSVSGLLAIELLESANLQRIMRRYVVRTPRDRASEPLVP